VIGIYFVEPIGSGEVDAVSAKFDLHYPHHQDVENLNVAVELQAGQNESAKAKVESEKGHRRSSTDMTELLVLWRSAFVVSQLAPYPGWDTFSKRFLRDWKVWKRNTGFRQIVRVGVRFINRIDIPAPWTVVEHETYLNVYPRLPNLFGPLDAYAVQVVVTVPDIGCQLTLNSAMVPSPILGHLSFLIDQDIAMNTNPPQSDDAIIELLNQIRLAKNKVFESCITDRARALFQ